MPPPHRPEDHSTDVATYAREIAAARKPELRRVVVIEGPDAGKTFDLDPHSPSRILVGTSPACQVRLTDSTVSRRHAAFEPPGSGGGAGQQYRLADLESTNGTFVDGTRIVEVFVHGGETVRFGSSAVQLEAGVALVDPEPLPSAVRFGRTIGASVAMRRLYPLCERLANTRIPAIIEGETGTGKEVLAESLHEVSGSKGPFVVFDCTTVSASLVEAELFGHERGAFTGAIASRPGVFEEADGGTLLIDEIGDLDLALQAKLLRVIDRSELRRIGGQKTIRVDVRVLAATRRDLDKEVAAGRFRDDLFHRLAVARIELPPLRERHGDVGLLARQFTAEMGGSHEIAELVVKRFANYQWPGNARELRNLIARYVALGADVDLDGGGVGAGPASSAFPPAARGAPSAAAPSVVAPTAATAPSAPATRSTTGTGSGGSGSGSDFLDGLIAQGLPFALARAKTLEEFQRRYVQAALVRHNGSITQAAKASGLALRYFRLVKARMQRMTEE
jgi:two-component system, NtrC family, response regulator HydG